MCSVAVNRKAANVSVSQEGSSRAQMVAGITEDNSLIAEVHAVATPAVGLTAAKISADDAHWGGTVGMALGIAADALGENGVAAIAYFWRVFTATLASERMVHCEPGTLGPAHSDHAQAEKQHSKAGPSRPLAAHADYIGGALRRNTGLRLHSPAHIGRTPSTPIAGSRPVNH